jgi:hypothetical protein
LAELIERRRQRASSKVKDEVRLSAYIFHEKASW